MKKKILFLALFGLMYGAKMYAQCGSDIHFKIVNATCSGSICITAPNGTDYCCYCYSSGNQDICINGTPNCGGNSCSALRPGDMGVGYTVSIHGCGSVTDNYSVYHDGGGWHINFIPNGSNTFSNLHIPDIGISVDGDGTSLDVSSPGCSCTDNDGNVEFF